MRDYRKKIISLALGASLCCGVSAVAETPADSIAIRVSSLIGNVAASETSTWNMRMAVASGSPAAMFYGSPFSLSSAYVKGDYLHRDRPLRVQDGTGHSLATVAAKSYMRLSRSTVVWGDANFRTGRLHDVCWNNAADYDLVGPYVLADSVGGDLDERRYSFSGGYAGYKRGWTWGAHASYTACIDYRNRDPRDKIVVSDLRVSLGASGQICGRYALAVDGAMRVYNQESDIDFYNPNNLIRLYALTGLGMWYPRFSGNTANSVAYSGVGLGGGLSLVPVAEADAEVFASARFMFQPVKQTLRDFNNLELTRSQHYEASFRVGVALHPGGNVRLTPQVEGSLHRQLGFENIFGSSVGNNYLLIGTRRNYYHDRVFGCVSVPVEVRCSQSVIVDVCPRGTLHYSREDYRSPHRYLEASKAGACLKAGAHWRCAASVMLSLEGEGGHEFSLSTRSSLAGIMLTSGIGTTVLENFEMLASGTTSGMASFRVVWAFSPQMALDVRLGGGCTSYLGRGIARGAAVSAGLRF